MPYDMQLKVGEPAPYLRAKVHRSTRRDAQRCLASVTPIVTTCATHTRFTDSRPVTLLCINTCSDCFIDIEKSYKICRNVVDSFHRYERILFLVLDLKCVVIIFRIVYNTRKCLFAPFDFHFLFRVTFGKQKMNLYRWYY